MVANLWMAFDDRAQPVANAVDANENSHKVFQALGDPSVRGIFRQHNPNGPRSYELWSLYYEVNDGIELLQTRNDLNAEFPGQLRTIGAWWFDTGAQVLNPAGTQPQFPLHATILEYIPDIVTHDSAGNEISRIRPSVPSDVNLGLGQTPREF